MSYDDDNEVEVTVETVVAATEAALLCKFDTGDQVWVPRVYTHPLGKVGDRGDIMLPFWLASKEGLV
jgi:hypothetical protein